MRQIILHYHLFKNAGTSIDQILRANFKDKWVTSEFARNGAAGNTPEVEEWIKSTPEAIAFSSHTMSGPLPVLPGVTIIPVIALRDPLARIRSAYKFERQQDAETYGAKLAKMTDFRGYVEARLAQKGDEQCRNFQVQRLSAFSLGEGSKLDQAKTAVKWLNEHGAVVLVSDFDAGMERLKSKVATISSAFDWTATRANTSEKLPPLKEDAALTQILIDANADDIALVKFATEFLVSNTH